MIGLLDVFNKEHEYKTNVNFYKNSQAFNKLQWTF